MICGWWNADNHLWCLFLSLCSFRGLIVELLFVLVGLDMHILFTRIFPKKMWESWVLLMFVFSLLCSLDTFPYAGTTTTCESLFMGVPCVTMAGSVHAHNVGVSLLNKVGEELFPHFNSVTIITVVFPGGVRNTVCLVCFFMFMRHAWFDILYQKKGSLWMYITKERGALDWVRARGYVGLLPWFGSGWSQLGFVLLCI